MKKEVLRYLLLLLISCISAACSNKQRESENDINSNVYPTGVTKPVFKKTVDDTLKVVKEIEKYEGSTVMVGEISGMAADSTNIYLSDFQQCKVIVLDRKNLKYKYSMGNGPGRGPGDLNNPTGIFIYKGNVLVQHHVGQYLFSLFSPDGKFIRSINRPSYDLNYSAGPAGSLLNGSTVYFTRMMAVKLKKMETVQLTDSSATGMGSLLPLTDFYAKTDSAHLTKIMGGLYVLKSALLPQFYAVTGSKPLINTYSFSGKLLKSFDLRSIPVLNTFYDDTSVLFPGESNLNYFSSVTADDQDNIFLYASTATNIDKFLKHEIKIDKVNYKTCYIVVNPVKLEYKLYHCEVRKFKPLQVIGNQLWSFDISQSKIVVHQLPQSGI